MTLFCILAYSIAAIVSNVVHGWRDKPIVQRRESSSEELRSAEPRLSADRPSWPSLRAWRSG